MAEFFSVEKMPRISIIAGHYGCGKTNTAVNLALAQRALGRRVVIVDLDIVNPYFRSADFAELFREQDIELIAPVYAGSNLDIPALGAQINKIFADDSIYAIIDVGGDDAGAIALGRYAAKFKADGNYAMYYVANCYRYLEQTPEEADVLLREIEAASRLQFSALLNCSNLGKETTAQTLLDSRVFFAEVCQRTALPALFTAARRDVAQQIKDDMPPVFPVDIYVLPPWEQE